MDVWNALPHEMEVWKSISPPPRRCPAINHQSYMTCIQQYNKSSNTNRQQSTLSSLASSTSTTHEVNSKWTALAWTRCSAFPLSFFESTPWHGPYLNLPPLTRLKSPPDHFLGQVPASSSYCWLLCEAGCCILHKFEYVKIGFLCFAQKSSLHFLTLWCIIINSCFFAPWTC